MKPPTPSDPKPDFARLLTSAKAWLGNINVKMKKVFWGAGDKTTSGCTWDT